MFVISNVDWDKLCNDTIYDIIKKNEEDYLEISDSFNRLRHIHNEDYTIEFRIVEIGGTITISRVAFKNKRNGCMTKCLNAIKKEGEEKRIHKIVIQSVLTREMSACCRKNGFEPSPTASMYDFEQGFTVGDYVYEFEK